MSAPKRRQALLLALLLCAAASIRALALWDDADSLLYRTGGLDAPQYLDMARRFARGQWPDAAPFFWPPGYSMFLGLLALISEKALWLKAVQVGLGTLSCGLVGALASRMFHSPKVTMLSIGMAAAYGPLVYYDLQISPASLDVFLSLLLLVLVLEAHFRSSLWLWSAAGIVAAAAAITRGAVLVFLPVILIWMARESPSDAHSHPLSRIAPALLLLAPTLLALTLVARHNHRYDGGRHPSSSAASDWGTSEILISYNAGINFLLGNDADMYAINRVEHPLCFLNYQMASYEPVLHGESRPSAQSRYLFRKGIRWVADHPVDWLRLMARKVGELVHGNEISRDTSIYASRIENGVLSWLIWKRGIAFPSGILIPLALLGIAFAPFRQSVLVLGALASQALFILAFFVTTRYRLALWTTAIPYAAYAVASVVDASRSWNRPRLFFAAALLLLAFALSNAGAGKAPSVHAAFEYDHLGHVLDQRGEHDEAARQWQSALRVDPRYAQAHFQLANHYARRADLRRAEAHYTEGLRAAPATFAARMEYAKLLIGEHRSKEATDQINRVLSQLPSPSSARTAVCLFAAAAGLDVRSEC